VKDKYEKLSLHLKSLEEENNKLKIDLDFLNEQSLKAEQLEKKIIEFEEQKTIKSRNFELMLNQAKIWEKKVSTIESDKEELATELNQIKVENEKLNEDLNTYLDRCREARSELKQEKMKSDSMIGQWRFYRHQHKKIKREMKKICNDIDLILNDSSDSNQFKSFIIALKKR